MPVEHGRKEEHMATREEFLEHLWEAVINANLTDAALDNIIGNCRRNPDGRSAKPDQQ
jgi:hypothetical protein